MSKAKSPLQQKLADARAILKTQKVVVAELAAKVKMEREANKENKVALAIKRAEARLQKLLAKQVGPVGSKLAKANRKPSKGVIVTA